MTSTQTQFAANTQVSVGKSRDDIERTLQRYGADSFAYGWQGDEAMVGFVVKGRQVRFILPLPRRDAAEFTTTDQGRPRTASAALNAHEQAVKARWRQLLLVVKAKLQAVESGIVTFEQEFAMHMVLPDGQTVAQHVLPAIQVAYESGDVPPLLGPMAGRTARALPGKRVE